MRVNKILVFLSAVLLLSALLLTASIVNLTKELYLIPKETVDDIVKILSEDGVLIDPEIIPRVREKTTVYICTSENYNTTVASLVGQARVKDVFKTPTGDLILLENGARVELGDNFSFRYRRNESELEDPQPFDMGSASTQLSSAKISEISRIATEFMDRGSHSLEKETQLNVSTVTDNVWEKDGYYYAILSRTIEGVEITKNRIICTLFGGEVIGAYGTWSFLVPSESYSAQFSDIINILFNVKKDIAEESEDGISVRITAIESCYSLYFYDENAQFCLIPSVRIVTDTMGDFIYNAIDSALYAKT